jgi:hypothetical protein
MMGKGIFVFASLVTALTLAGAGLSGCTTAPAPRPDDSALYDQGGQRRSVVLDTAQLQRAVAAEAQDDLPWYTYRQDLSRSTERGLRLPTLESSYTRTIDRQQQFGGRIFDHYHSTTYRQTVKQTAY